MNIYDIAKEAVVSLCDGKKRERDELLNRIRDKENEISRCQNAAIGLNGTLTDQERDLVKNSELDAELAGYLSAKDHGQDLGCVGRQLPLL